MVLQVLMETQDFLGKQAHLEEMDKMDCQDNEENKDYLVAQELMEMMELQDNQELLVTQVHLGSQADLVIVVSLVLLA